MAARTPSTTTVIINSIRVKPGARFGPWRCGFFCDGSRAGRAETSAELFKWSPCRPGAESSDELKTLKPTKYQFYRLVFIWICDVYHAQGAHEQGSAACRTPPVSYNGSAQTWVPEAPAARPSPCGKADRTSQRVRNVARASNTPSLAARFSAQLSSAQLSSTQTGAWSLGRSFLRGARSMLQAVTWLRSAALTRMWSMRKPWFLRKARLR